MKPSMMISKYSTSRLESKTLKRD